MLVAAIETSTLTCAVGWIQVSALASRPDVVQFALSVSPAKPGHAEVLLARLEAALGQGGHSFRDLDLVVYGRGPGTFTGLRIGLGVAKGLALAHGTPTVGLSSLEALAVSLRASGKVAAVIDARRGELFGALYEVSWREGWPEVHVLMPERVGPAATVIADVGAVSGFDALIAGNGVAPYLDVIRNTPGLAAQDALLAAPCPYWMARLGLELFAQRGADDIDAAVPVYLREPDARLPAIPQSH